MRFVLAALSVLLAAGPGLDSNYYVTMVRPVVARRCSSCHNFADATAAANAFRRMKPGKKHANVYGGYDAQVVKAWLGGARMEKPVENAPSFNAFVEKIQPILTQPGSDG